MSGARRLSSHWILALPALFFSFFPALWIGCASTKEPQGLYHQDAYFFDDSVQIQGNAAMPQIRTEKNGEVAFLTLPQRRAICHKHAIQNGQAKWLALSWNHPGDEEYWMGALSREEKLPGGCLDSYNIRHIFYDDMNSCRVVLIFPCRPQDD